MGVVEFPAHGTTSDVILRSADAALYQAKAQGRDRVEVAKPIEGTA
jgi:GGDEF domain-containing protein